MEQNDKEGVLVITRKVSQSVTIKTKSGEIIMVYISRINGGKQVRIGFQCDRDVLIARTEKLINE